MLTLIIPLVLLAVAAVGFALITASAKGDRHDEREFVPTFQWPSRSVVSTTPEEMRLRAKLGWSVYDQERD